MLFVSGFRGCARLETGRQGFEGFIGLLLLAYSCLLRELVGLCAFLVGLLLFLNNRHNEEAFSVSK